MAIQPILDSFLIMRPFLIIRIVLHVISSICLKIILSHSVSSPWQSEKKIDNERKNSGGKPVLKSRFMGNSTCVKSSLTVQLFRL